MRLYQITCEDCGRVTTARTGPLAEHGNRRHSCDRTRMVEARAQRVKARREDPGVKRECHHPEADHQHGTDLAYKLDRCRCRPCRDAHSEAALALSKAKAYGRYDLGRVDAQEAREHLLRLSAAGVGYKRAAELAGIATTTAAGIIYGRPERGEGPRKRIERRVHEAILAVRPGLESVRDGRRVPGHGTRRRLEALGWLGYSVNEISARSGVERQALDHALHGREVFAVTHRAVAALYEDLWDKPNQPGEWHAKSAASRARNKARKLGWAPPLAWDEDTIDDPDAAPADPERVLSKAEAKLEDVDFMLRCGIGTAEILARTGWTVWSFEQAALRYGQPELVHRFRAVGKHRDVA